MFQNRKMDATTKELRTIPRKIIIFEGISGAGKSTIEDAFRADDDYYNYTIHRFSASKYVYGVLNNRPYSLKALEFEEKTLKACFDVRQVLLLCDPATAFERKKKLGDQNVENDLGKAQELYINYINKYTKFNTKVFNTYTYSVDAIVKMIRDSLGRRM